MRGRAGAILMVVLLGCGDRGDAEPQLAVAPAAKPGAEMRCTLRVSGTGIRVDGEPRSQAEALAICKRSTGAVVVLEDDAPQDEWTQLEAALRREGLAIHLRGPVGHADCTANPLARGCP